MARRGNRGTVLDRPAEIEIEREMAWFGGKDRQMFLTCSMSICRNRLREARQVRVLLELLNVTEKPKGNCSSD